MNVSHPDLSLVPVHVESTRLRLACSCLYCLKTGTCHCTVSAAVPTASRSLSGPCTAVANMARRQGEPASSSAAVNAATSAGCPSFHSCSSGSSHGSEDKPDPTVATHDRALAGWRKLLRHIFRIQRLRRIWAYLGHHLQQNVPKLAFPARASRSRR